jgi:hypothetical protein
VKQADFVNDPTFSGLSIGVQLDLQRAAKTHIDLIVLEEWLKEIGFEKYMSR